MFFVVGGGERGIRVRGVDLESDVDRTDLVKASVENDENLKGCVFKPQDTREFVAGSKYLLHRIRHQAMVRIAHEEGYTGVELKDGSTVEIQAGDLCASRKALRDKHKRSVERVISNLVDDEVQDALGEANEIGLSEWVSRNQD